MDGDAAITGNILSGSGASYDFGVALHSPIMHNALENSKRLLRYSVPYALGMTTPGERLRFAREKAGYETAVAAAEALAMRPSTYIGHENGGRGIPRDRAPIYARKFKVTEEWLLYGKGDIAGEAMPEPARPIPILGDVPAGNWREAMNTSRVSMPSPDPSVPAEAYALKVVGDSMNRIAGEGATIIIDPTERDLYERWLYVVRNGDGDVTFKQYLERPARLVPCSTNPEHKEIPIADRDYEIVGRVIWIAMRPDQAALA